VTALGLCFYETQVLGSGFVNNGGNSGVHVSGLTMTQHGPQPAQELKSKGHDFRWKSMLRIYVDIMWDGKQGTSYYSTDGSAFTHWKLDFNNAWNFF